MKVTKMASNSGNSKKKYNNIYEILDIVLDTNGDSDMDFDLDDSDSEDYDSEWEGEPRVTQNPSPVRGKITSSPPPVPVVEEKERSVPGIEDELSVLSMSVSSGTSGVSDDSTSSDDEPLANKIRIDDVVIGRRRRGVHTRTGAQFQARGRGQQRDAMDSSESSNDVK